MGPVFFPTPVELRAWFEQRHEDTQEVLIGFYKKGSSKPSITWAESVDVALCFGWIDGVRRSIDETSYMIRFTPRKARSTWSAVNIKRVAELTEMGLMQPAGLGAFERRIEEKSNIYAYEQAGEPKLDEAYESQFRANESAWAFFQAQAPWYRRTAIWQIISAKQEKTRLKRLAQLIEDSAQGRTVHSLTRNPKPD